MLSSIGRASVRRVVSCGPQSTNRTLQSIWQLQRTDNNQNTNNAPTRSQFSFSVQRSYATATKVAAKPKASKTTPTKSSTKKVVKKPVKKTVKKKVVAKKSVKKPVKRIQSEATLARIEAAKKAANVNVLKAAALTTSPKTKPSTTWRVVLAEAVKPGMNASSLARDAASKYKALSPAELESYNHIAAQNAAENKAMHKKWVESYTPDQIRLANNARRALRLLAKDNKRIKSLPSIEDERQPKGRVSARAIYCGDRWASGDFKGIALSDASKLMAKEWDALPSSERQAYQERELADKQRYVKEFRAAFKRDPEYAAPVEE